MELNREQIIKALECCSGIAKCVDCPYAEKEDCAKQNARDVIELIKELTEENERLEHICNSYALQYGTAADKEVFLKAERADTVRKMQERLKAHFDTYTDEDEETALYMRNLIDQIAKEMLEDAD